MTRSFDFTLIYHYYSAQYFSKSNFRLKIYTKKLLDTQKVKMEEYSLSKADKRRRAMFKKLDEDPERIKGSIFGLLLRYLQMDLIL